ncbi:hypothetical protein [Rhodococcus sp. NPDC059234]|uniref:hypothetical protein n=1 Tax=Rhodococcus sp. NPDC059234 TaxID=3346781 RepID=UPI00366D2EDC
MTILIQVLEQGYSQSTPWEQRRYHFVDAARIIGIRLDGQLGVWIDMARPGESHQLAVAVDAENTIYFMLRAFDKIANCERLGGSWLIGHDGTDFNSIQASPYGTT